MQKRLENKSTIKLSRNSGSFTLVELLISTLIFSIVTVIAASFFITVLRAHRRADLEDYLYSEARLMMEKLVMEVRRGTIDYEEYYSRLVVEGADPSAAYGKNYWAYGQQFWDPGKDDMGNIGNFGSLCNDGSAYDGICIRLRESIDINTGQNPYDSANATAQATKNAFCESGCTNDPIVQDELYLINDAGNLKTIIVKERTKTAEYAISIVHMEGFDYGEDHIDSSNDNYEDDDVIDTWFCTADFHCDPNPLLPDPGDRTSTSDQGALNTGNFVPITPLDLNVTELKFIIAPVEDPHKAFAEDAMQVHPYVTIILTVEPSEEAWGRLGLATPPEITLQTTVSPRVYRQIESFKPPL